MNPNRPIPRSSVMEIEAYVPGKSGAPGAMKVYKLSSNETPLGPSPKAVAAFREAAGSLELYPDGAATRLRVAIGERYGLDPQRIVCGNGSDDLLHLIASAFVGEGDEGVFTEHGFLVYRIAILAAGGSPVVVPEKNLTADVDAILAAVSPRTKIVFIANPNNPTGTYLPISEVKRLHAGLAPHVVLVLDHAYAEYVTRDDYANGLELANAHPNIVVTHTFSKIHGLASLRIGWAYGHPVVCDAVNRIRGPFNVNGAALEAGIAAIGDIDHVNAAIAHNDHWRSWLEAQIAELGLKVTPSVGNFVLMHFPDEPGKSAADADAFLSARGLVLRRVSAYGLPNALRMTVGAEEPNRLVVEALTEFVAGKL